MTVVSEGVETLEQHRLLAGLGCDACQGFYFARPMAGSGLRRLIDDRGDLAFPIASGMRDSGPTSEAA